MKTTKGVPPRLVNIQDFAAYCGLGRCKAQEFGRDSGSRVEIGSRVLYDLRKADAYIDKLETIKM